VESGRRKAETALANVPQRGYSKTMNRILRLAAVLLFALARNGPAYGGEIHDAAERGAVEKVKALLKANPDLVNRITPTNEWTPLMYAAGHGHQDVAELLLANQADPNAKDVFGFTPLVYVADFGKKDMAGLLVAYKGDVNARTKGGETALLRAAATGNQEVAELVLLNHADVNATNNLGQTPLIVARKKDMVELLLANGADVNAEDARGMTPLLMAVQLPQLKDVIAPLLDRKAMIHLHQANPGETPLWCAVMAGNQDGVASLLSTTKDDINAKTSNGCTPLHMAAFYGYQDVAGLLLANGAAVNATNNTGDTPLHWAAGYGHQDIAGLLLANGAEVNATNNLGKTPLHGLEEASLADAIVPEGLPASAAAAFAAMIKATQEGEKAVAELLRQHGGHE